MPDTEDLGSQEPSWYIDESTPGPGDRPSFLPEKFKSVSDLANGYSELEKKFGSAPSEYDFSKGSDWIDSDYDGFKELAQVAKEKRVPQEVLDKMLETTGSYLGQFKTDFNAELHKLGDNAKERLTVLDNWAAANLSEKARDALFNSIDTAEGIEAIEELRGIMMGNESNIPTGNESDMTSTLTVEEVQDEIARNIDKYTSDETYRNEMKRKIERVAPNSGFKDKSSMI